MRGGRIVAGCCVAGCCVALLFSTRTFAAEPLVTERFEGRDLLVDVPATVSPAGSRALVIVLHGGLGSARGIVSGRSESALDLHAVAAANDFVVAYLNGTMASARFGPDALGWNAGGCCGLPDRKNVDDAGFIARVVDRLVAEHGIDRRRVYAVGHSNGAMMAQRMLCERDVFAAIVAVSGPLTLAIDRCPAARGKRVLALHGADDRNVPVGGGRGPEGLSGTSFRSEAESRTIFEDSGADYTAWILPGAEHRLGTVDAALVRTHGVTIAGEVVAFFGLGVTREAPQAQPPSR